MSVCVCRHCATNAIGQSDCECVHADYPQGRHPVIDVAAPSDTPNMLSGQRSAAVSSTSQAAIFNTLLVKAKPGVYTITFTSTDHTVQAFATIWKRSLLRSLCVPR